ncbi:MAG: alanine--tRNA ligase [Gammaproteobacteria bacterium]|uniref:Alanine--tRNA ligase n=1 Tax=Candidatus Thiopontia autotrophica TaxID=2841688 RepID=A0A8J6PBH3_9GAMM|nr:alanine--tRNA ligase [Candidatus Thiopontia autotrophica]
MKSNEIRTAFLDFFEQKGHQVVDSSPLIPANDPTLLFVNAGMVQFKDVFLGQEKRNYSRATSVQRCLRAGGKHNDLENVGYTARHHTFFEMLGNFSFGDYFKRDAIQYAWEFLTVTLGLPEEKLWVTVYEEDPEAEDIWLKEMKVSAERFSRCGAKDNFWSMGDTGPCGPCSEIFYDHGEEIAGGPPGSPDEDGDRYIEIWNLVFMQYDRDNDGTLNSLPHPSVDTGMGLERLAAILQNGHSNYDIDLFQNLMKAVAKETGVTDHNHTSVKVIADHIRSCAFLAVDGVVPSNEGRGYVMRRIVRRAIRHGYKLGQPDPFFHKLVAPLVAEMGEAYPALPAAQQQVERVLLKEEQRFAETLDQGMRILEESIAALDGDEIPGETIFKLYDTYGFPVDLTGDIARERNLTLDLDGYEKAMTEQRDRARSASSFKSAQAEGLEIEGETKFSGYDGLEDQSTVVALFKEGTSVQSLDEGDSGVVVLESTPFYGESGGQAGDMGLLNGEGLAYFEGEDTQKQTGGTILHIGEGGGGTISIDDIISAKVDVTERKATARNHSATHLAHAALRKILGDHVQQKGSQVNGNRLRFDFSHFEPMTDEQIHEVERQVNEQILASHPVDSQVMSIDDAKATGAMALFGEKYGDEVRVVRMDEYSTELCGGTHVASTGEIGMFRILSESGVAAGVRRMEAVTGEGALAYVESGEQTLQQLASLVKASRETVGDKVQALVEQSKKMEKELERLKSKLASASSGDLVSEAVESGGVKVLITHLEGADVKTLRTTMDQLKDKLGTAAILLATASGGKVVLVAGVTKDATDRIKAGDMVRHAAELVGGKGGGRPDMAQGGGSDPSGIPDAIESTKAWAQEVLQ